MSSAKIFISATSADLAPARRVVKEALLTIGCHPIEQTNFPLDWRTVTQMLDSQIGECQALIHIAGLYYGTEPDPTILPAGAERRSYTQMEYETGRRLQHRRGDRRFRVYTFVCPDGFPYQPIAKPQSDAERELQAAHRARLTEGAALYEMPADLEALKVRVLTLHEDVQALRAVQDKRARLTLASALAVVLALVGAGYGIYRTYTDVPVHTAVEVAKQFDAEIVATRLRQEIETRFAQETQEAREAGKHWETIRKLERRRDVALGRIDEVVRTIKEGLTVNPSPLFVEAIRILEAEGVDPALAYLESHHSDQMGRVDQAATQVEAAQKTLRRELQPLALQADLYESQLAWSKAVEIRELITKKAPQWFEARNQLGMLLHRLARYADAETHFRFALMLAQTPRDETVAMNNLAQLLQATNRLDEAEPLMRKALTIDEARFGKIHHTVAIDLNNLASLLYATNRLSEAEPLMRRALTIDEVSYGKDHPKVAIRLNNLAMLLQATNRLDEAEPLMRRALAIAEASYGKVHPNVARHLSNIALLLIDSNRADEAESLLQQALTIDEASYGKDHPKIATDLNNLAALLKVTNRMPDAEPLLQRALTIEEASYGKEHPKVAIVLKNLARILQDANRLDEAEPLMRRALAIDEASYGKDHLKVGIVLKNLARILKDANRMDEAEPLMRRALAIDEAGYGKDHPKVAIDLNNLAILLEATKQLNEAEPLMRQALAIDEASYGKHHPKVAIRLNNLAMFLKSTNRLVEAETLLRRALEIDEASYDKDHPHTGIVLSNLAMLLKATNQLDEAEPLMRRALAIGEVSYGNDHPKVAVRLNNLATLLKATNRLDEAKPLSRRGVEILYSFGQHTGNEHPNMRVVLENYQQILSAMGKDEVAQQAAIEKIRESVQKKIANENTAAPVIWD